MKKKQQKAYIIYKYNKFKNDFEYIKEYYKLEEIQKDYNINNRTSIYQYISKNIEKLKKCLLNDRYIIIEETLIDIN